jgi:hypothetical protein
MEETVFNVELPSLDASFQFCSQCFQKHDLNFEHFPASDFITCLDTVPCSLIVTRKFEIKNKGPCSCEFSSLSLLAEKKMPAVEGDSGSHFSCAPIQMDGRIRIEYDEMTNNKQVTVYSSNGVLYEGFGVLD